MSDCLFCKIVKGQIKSDIVYQDDDVIAFRDINPQAPHHILCIPRQHIATVNEFTPTQAPLIGKLVLTASNIAKQLQVDQDGYRIVMNCNRMAGQTVFHVHLHLLAGRPMHWPPG
ncbi:MAG: histidine triad nucleotide-binding protein [Gammaproteobacteria bacterium]|nr:histidine triad nucleotide-binding protein [Gammaproteobacteria bacterium]